MCDEGRGVGPGGHGVYLDFRDAIARLGEAAIADRYGNLFQMYQRITAESPYRAPMRIYPAPHYTMGGLWVDYNLMSTIPGLHVIGEANFSDHGANRLGASALMQGLADGYFILPYTIGDYLAQANLPKLDATHPAVRQTGAEVAEPSRHDVLKIGASLNAPAHSGSLRTRRITPRRRAVRRSRPRGCGGSSANRSTTTGLRVAVLMP